jgi:hypothetical protein
LTTIHAAACIREGVYWRSEISTAAVACCMYARAKAAMIAMRLTSGHLEMLRTLLVHPSPSLWLFLARPLRPAVSAALYR